MQGGHITVPHCLYLVREAHHAPVGTMSCSIAEPVQKGEHNNLSSEPMSPMVRGLAQRGGPPGWLEDSDPAGCGFVRDGRSMPPAPANKNTCGLGLIY
jgi:hypothetical protein